MPDVDLLIRVLTPPGEPVSARGDWAEVEAEMGVALTADFMDLRERFGAGSFCDFLHPLWPFFEPYRALKQFELRLSKTTRPLADCATIIRQRFAPVEDRGRAEFDGAFRSIS